MGSSHCVAQRSAASSERWDSGLIPSPAQWVKDPALPHLLLRLWLWLGSDPRPGSSMCHGAARNGENTHTHTKWNYFFLQINSVKFSPPLRGVIYLSISELCFLEVVLSSSISIYSAGPLDFSSNLSPHEVFFSHPGLKAPFLFWTLWLLIRGRYMATHTKYYDKVMRLTHQTLLSGSLHYCHTSSC